MTKSLGRITAKRVSRAVQYPHEVELWCRDFVGIVEKDATTGQPVKFRRRCKNRKCCNPGEGMIAVHIWDLQTGEFETVELPNPARTP